MHSSQTCLVINPSILHDCMTSHYNLSGPYGPSQNRLLPKCPLPTEQLKSPGPHMNHKVLPPYLLQGCEQVVTRVAVRSGELITMQTGHQPNSVTEPLVPP